MLKQIYQSATFQYRKDVSYASWATNSSNGAWGNPKYPYKETIASLGFGLAVVPLSSARSPVSVIHAGGYAVTTDLSLTHLGHRLQTFDGDSGAFMSSHEINLGTFSNLIGFSSSRGGTLFANFSSSASYYTIGLWKIPVPLPDTLTNYPQDVYFAPSDFGVSVFNTPCIDEVAGYLLDSNQFTLYAWDLNTKAQLYTRTMPGQIIAMTLQDTNRVFILFINRLLVLYDYVRDEILGAVKIPPTSGGTRYWNSQVAMCWDSQYSRLLYMEQSPDDPLTGASTCSIRGFQTIPQPVRLTSPVPLDTQRTGRTVRVLTQLVGDLNEGVAGASVIPSVTGGVLQNKSGVTDFFGRVVTGVKCTSPGTVAINCTT